jgi:hypothetical protein
MMRSEAPFYEIDSAVRQRAVEISMVVSDLRQSRHSLISGNPR